MLTLYTASSSAVEYARVPFAGKVAGATIDPTPNVVSLAFLASATATPATSDWNTGTWETDAVTNPDTYYGRCLVGTGAVVLAAGTYTVWIKVVRSPETIVRRAGLIAVQ